MRNKFGKEITIEDIRKDYFWCGYNAVRGDVPRVSIEEPVSENGTELPDMPEAGIFGRAGSVVRNRIRREV